MLKDYFEVPNKPAIKSGNILSCDFTDHETFIPQPLDYSRGTLATYVDCNGLIKMSGVSDTELVTNGDFSNGTTGWTANNCALSVVDNTLKVTSTAGFGNAEQNITVVSGKTYKVSADFIYGGSVEGRLNAYDGSASPVEVAASDDTSLFFYITISAGQTNLRIRTVNQSSSTGVYNNWDNVSVKQVDVETPRIDYLTEIGKAKELQKPSLLLEPQSTNLVTFSEDFSGYTTNNSSISSNVISSPDGSLSASKLIENTATAEHTIQKQVSVTSGNAYSISVFVKKDEISSVQFGFTGSNFASPTRSIFDIENGIITTNVSNTASIQNYGNGWYKLKVTNTTNATGTAMLILQTIKSGQANYTGDGVSGFYMWGLQWEQQAYCTSYIPTSGSTVTRNQDLANNAGSAPVFNSEEGVLYCEIAALANDGTFREITLNDGTTSNAIEIRYVSTSNRLQCVARSGGGVTASLEFDLSNTTEFVKAALSYKANNFKMYLNGSLVATDTSGATPVGLNRLSFNWGGFNFFYGKTKEVKVFRRALTDSELQELTNNIV